MHSDNIVGVKRIDGIQCQLNRKPTVLKIQVLLY